MRVATMDLKTVATGRCAYLAGTITPCGKPTVVTFTSPLTGQTLERCAEHRDAWRSLAERAGWTIEPFSLPNGSLDEPA